MTGFRTNLIQGRLLTAVGLFLCLTLGGVAEASGLRVTPLRLDFSADDRSGNIQVSNLGANPMAVQVKAYSWRQENGQDIYEPTKDIFFAPPIVSIEGGKNTIVRFRLRSEIPKEQERAYRIYFQEVAPASNQTSGAGMAFRLRFGIPVFVRASQPTPPRLGVSGDVQENGLKLSLENDGGTHLRIDGIGVFPRGVDRERPDKDAVVAATQAIQGTNYLLPGAKLDWDMPFPEGTDTEGLSMLIRTDDYTAQAAPGMTSKGWLWVPLKTDGAAPPKD